MQHLSLEVSKQIVPISIPKKLQQELGETLFVLYKAVEDMLVANSSLFEQSASLFSSKNKLRIPITTKARRRVQSINREGLFKKEMAHFYNFWNQHAKQYGMIDRTNANRLRLLTAYLLIPSAEHFKHSQLILDVFKQLTHAVITDKSNRASEACLRPSLFFNQRVLYTKMIGQEEILLPELFEIKQNLVEFLKNPNLIVLPHSYQKLINYLKGEYELSDLMLTATNARAILMMIKLIDIAVCEYNRASGGNFIECRSSYELRSQILTLCSPNMTTGEAYTKTLDIRKYKDRAYLSRPSNWVPERVRIHLATTANLFFSTLGLSAKQEHIQPLVGIARGNTGAGKSTMIPNESLFDKAKDENGEMVGILNPDPGKKELRTIPLVNRQVHDEGVAIFNETLAKISSEAKKMSLMIEGRYSSIEEIENMLSIAKARNATVALLDIETVLITSLWRVLERNPFNNQCPPVQDIVKGYKESTLHLRKLIEIVAKEPAVKSYKLYYNDDQGTGHFVAEKINEVFTIYSQILLDKCCSLPSDAQIQEMLAMPITEGSIDSAIKIGAVKIDSKIKLAEWVGIPLGYAIDMHASGLTASKVHQLMQIELTWRAHYGDYELQPFDGEWLEDLQEIKRHIEIEQRLHSRGVDEQGKGLHFQTDKFNLKLNPDFNPEARLPGSQHSGLQMKIGYYIVPLNNVDTFMTKNLSLNVLKELEVHNADGDLIGYRLFVHPEAYVHLKALHSAGIRFVKPQDSEFMGAPTSSYRSWVVRRISGANKSEAVPFVAKFGVASSPTEIRRLLPREEIEKSIKTQRFLDELPQEYFNADGRGKDLIFFRENFGLALKGIDNYPPTS